MVDPALVQQANTDTVRPPAQPVSGAVPPDGVADAARKEETDTVRPAPPASGDCKQCAAARRALTLGALAYAILFLPVVGLGRWIERRLDRVDTRRCGTCRCACSMASCASCSACTRRS